MFLDTWAHPAAILVAAIIAIDLGWLGQAELGGSEPAEDADPRLPGHVRRQAS